MTQHSDIDRKLRHWMDSGPSTMPEHVVDVVADRIGRQAQRRSWRARPWVPVDLRAARSPLMIVAAVFLVAVFGAILLGRSGPAVTPGSTPSTPASTSRPTAPPPTVGPDWWRGYGCGPTGEPRCAGPLAPGVHSAGDAIPGLTFSVPAGWVNLYEFGSSYILIPDTADNRQSLAGFDGAATAIDLVGEDLAYTVECASDHRLRAFRSADEAMQGLSSRLGLNAGDPTTVAGDGLTGAAIDVAVAAGAAGVCQYDIKEGTQPDREQRMTYVIVLEINPSSSLSSAFAWVSFPGQRLRVVILDLPEGGMILARIYVRDAADYEDFVAAAMPIIESIRVER
jgi:hypothetical protein